MSQYTYLLGTLFPLFIWIILYYHRKDLRKPMLIMSILLCFLSSILEAFIWTSDWWRPVTLTNTLLGIEDIIAGFSMGGIVAVIYEEVFKKKHSFNKRNEHHHNKAIIILSLLSIFLGNLLFFYFTIHSFYATIVALLIPTLIIYSFRKDLIIDSILSGILTVIIALPIYGIWYLLDTSYVESWWYLGKLIGVNIFGVPIEEYLWWFFAGLAIGPLYEFWYGGHLQNIKKHKP